MPNKFRIKDYEDPSYTEETKSEIIQILKEMIEDRYFTAGGPYSNWKWTIDNPPIRWGLQPGASNDGVFKKIRIGDFVFFFSTRDGSPPFTKRGLFGLGIVNKKYDTDIKYYPDEIEQNKVIWANFL